MPPPFSALVSASTLEAIWESPHRAWMAPLITLGVVAYFEVLRHLSLPVLAPVIILGASVVVASLWGGWRGGVLGAVFMAAYLLRMVLVEPGSTEHVQGLPGAIVGSVFMIGSGICVGLFSDASRRLLHDVRARESRARAEADEVTVQYRRLVETAQEGIWQIDAKQQTVYVNPAMAAMLGYTPDEMIGKPVFSFLDPAFHADVRAQLAQRRQGQSGTAEHPFNHRDGSTIWAKSSTTPLFDGDRYVGAFALYTDISEQRRAQDAERRALGRVRHLAHRIADVQEHERRFLAQELHDEFGQQLTLLKFLIEQCRDSGATPEALQQGYHTTTELIRRVRAISLDLRPALLDDLGLIPALLALAEQQRPLTVEVRHKGVPTSLGTAVQTAAYRIVQEALTNAVRHAKASTVTVMLYHDGEALIVEVADDGHGFDHQAFNSILPTSSGLTGMEERALALGGQFDLASAPGEGVRVRAVLPCSAQLALS